MNQSVGLKWPGWSEEDGFSSVSAEIPTVWRHKTLHPDVNVVANPTFANIHLGLMDHGAAGILQGFSVQ